MTENERAIQALKELRDDCYEIDEYGKLTDECAEELWAIDTAIEALQERRTSKWNLKELHNCYEVYQCEKCGREITVFHNYGCSPTIVQVTADYPYCHCGAKMEVENGRTETHN